ncbi:hypothetical protein BDW22DRAFT_1361664 [Trametopsis cervina]|nr:hypothetical protein BDW22DRAFT_1361664 [Trametopsis cervina]
MVPLPPELLNRIFDFVELSASRHVGLPDSLDISDDITSDTLPTTRTRTHDLKTCRLVSKQWEQLVLPRLFSRLFILGASHYYSFMDLITGCTTVPLMMLHIKKLWFHTWVDSTGGTPDNALLDIITLLPALQFLQLSFVDKDDQSVPASTRERYAELASKDRFAPTGSNHTRLMLDKLSLSLTDPNPRHLTKLGSVLQRFSSIGTLTLRSMTIESIAVLRFISGTLDTPDANLPPEVVIGELQVSSITEPCV